MSPASIPKIDLLRSRAEALAAARAFFQKRGVLEVDCNALVRAPPLDSNIEVMSVAVTSQETGYLHTSPEYAMKKLAISSLFLQGPFRSERSLIERLLRTMRASIIAEIPSRPFMRLQKNMPSTSLRTPLFGTEIPSSLFF